MEKTIRVTGKGKLSVRPDTVRLILTLQDTRRQYSDSLHLAAKRTDLMKEVLAEFGFQHEDVRTLSFGVERTNEGYRDKNNDWKYRFKGYQFTHVLKVEFPEDNERLGKILSALGQCEGDPDIRIEYTVSDPESIKNTLLGKAVADSRSKAEVLTSAAGVKLEDLITIDYSWGEIELVTRPIMNNNCFGKHSLMSDCEADGIDIEPDDIDIEDTVTVVWSIR